MSGTHPNNAPTAPPTNDIDTAPITLSATELKLYDRQLRAWGHDQQEKLLRTTVLFHHVDGINTEILKNLVLSGVGRVLVVDRGYIADFSDAETNMFVRKEDVVKKRAVVECVVERVRELNPHVKVRMVRVQGGLQGDQNNVQQLGGGGGGSNSGFTTVRRGLAFEQRSIANSNRYELRDEEIWDYPTAASRSDVLIGSLDDWREASSSSSKFKHVFLLEHNVDVGFCYTYSPETAPDLLMEQTLNRKQGGKKVMTGETPGPVSIEDAIIGRHQVLNMKSMDRSGNLYYFLESAARIIEDGGLEGYYGEKGLRFLKENGGGNDKMAWKKNIEQKICELGLKKEEIMKQYSGSDSYPGRDTKEYDDLRIIDHELSELAWCKWVCPMYGGALSGNGEEGVDGLRIRAPNVAVSAVLGGVISQEIQKGITGSHRVNGNCILADLKEELGVLTMRVAPGYCEEVVDSGASVSSSTGVEVKNVPSASADACVALSDSEDDGDVKMGVSPVKDTNTANPGAVENDTVEIIDTSSEEGNAAEIPAGESDEVNASSDNVDSGAGSGNNDELIVLDDTESEEKEAVSPSGEAQQLSPSEEVSPEEAVSPSEEVSPEEAVSPSEEVPISPSEEQVQEDEGEESSDVEIIQEKGPTRAVRRQVPVKKDGGEKRVKR